MAHFLSHNQCRDLRTRRARYVLNNTDSRTSASAAGELENPNFIYSVNISGNRIVTGDVAGWVRVWDAGESDDVNGCLIHFPLPSLKSPEPASQTSSPTCSCRSGRKLWQVRVPLKYRDTLADDRLLNVTLSGDYVVFALYDGHVFVYRLAEEELKPDDISLSDEATDSELLTEGLNGMPKVVFGEVQDVGKSSTLRCVIIFQISPIFLLYGGSLF